MNNTWQKKQSLITEMLSRLLTIANLLLLKQVNQAIYPKTPAVVWIFEMQQKKQFPFLPGLAGTAQPSWCGLEIVMRRKVFLKTTFDATLPRFQLL
jgi:hypothetical protein